MKLTQLTALLLLGLSLAATARADGWGDHDHDRDDHHGPGWGHPVYPGYLGWGPGFVPGPGPGYCPPGFVPPPPPPPGWYPAPGYVFTCFSQNNIGQWFYATALDPNFAQAQAMNFCATSGAYCVPTGCR